MVTLGKRTTAVLRVRSLVETLNVHFTTRSLVCGRLECPMCVYERARQRWYVGCDIDGTTDILEVPQSLLTCIFDARNRLGVPTTVGLVLQLSRPNNRRPWKVTKEKYSRADALPQSQLVLFAANLFRVEIPDELPDWMEFREIAAAAHRGLLQAAVLPFKYPLVG